MPQGISQSTRCNCRTSYTSNTQGKSNYMSELTHDKEQEQYTLHLENGQEAFISYVLEGKKMKLTYSFVPPELRGSGVGKELVEKTFEKLTEEGYEAEAMCSYIRVVAQRHPKWSAIID